MSNRGELKFFIICCGCSMNHLLLSVSSFFPTNAHLCLQFGDIFLVHDCFFHLVAWGSLTSLRRLAKALPKQSVDGKAPLATGEEDDDEVPDLVENFDEASKNEAN
ncbi:hypothetical protein P7K49_030484 [Saguinus oedipus]|uniref:Uncharacterized protein n=1 Tax=Saguinus oedipus TaxID=9490 RepID=A0ABQ9U359_SAGOE|nr:hypothetical protein P7K49_030484 [Saguinus oedipus]